MLILQIQMDCIRMSDIFAKTNYESANLFEMLLHNDVMIRRRPATCLAECIARTAPVVQFYFSAT